MLNRIGLKRLGFNLERLALISNDQIALFLSVVVVMLDVVRNDEDLKEPLARAALVKDCRAKGSLSHKECEFTYQPEAKSCPVVSECFSGKYL